MGEVTAEYQKRVLDEMKNYAGLSHPVKASMLERLCKKKVSIKKLHPNPEDEFSMVKIGPNYGIVGNYESEFRNAINHGMNPMEEPLVVEKMSTGGYLILNGHHRWMAAWRTDIKRVPVEIVNVTKDDDIISAVKQSKNEMCASLDLDEVLFTDGIKYPAEKKLGLNGVKYKYMLRKNAPELINELRRMGFDVWVYTGSYYSESYINKLFKLHHTKVDGIINGMKNKKSSSEVKTAFSEKYKISLHIDSDSLLCVDTRTKEYDSYEVESGSGWAAEIATALKKSRYTHV